MSTLFKVLLAQTSIGGLLRYVPFLPALYARYVWSKRWNAFWGVFGSYKEACDEGAKHLGVGWSEDSIAEEMAGGPSMMANERDLAPIDRERVQPSTYAALFWIEKLLQPGETIVDYGGAGGVTYDVYHRYGQLPDGAMWRVIETPPMAEKGLARIKADGLTNLDFGSELEQCQACDFLLTAGCIQYVSPDEAKLLERAPSKPKYLLINKLPTTSGPEFWTLQNIGGVSAAPYRVFNRKNFIAEIESQGYRLIDHWDVSELSTSIPFYPNHFIPKKDGLLFERV